VDSEDIPFGMRRYWLALGLFSLGGAGFIAWSRTVDEPTFVFPFGRLGAENARLVLLLVGVGALLYTGALVYLRFVKRPVVALRADSITIPHGEFAQTSVTLRPGDVLSVRQDGPRAGGWRTCHVQYRGGVLMVRSSALPSDEAYFRVCERLSAFVKRA
jgi:hypothetical protein